MGYVSQFKELLIPLIPDVAITYNLVIKTQLQAELSLIRENTRNNLN
jgi:hypothetical protein